MAIALIPRQKTDADEQLARGFTRSRGLGAKRPGD